MIDNNLSFIDPNKNDCFSCLRGLDLQELLFQINNFYLSYRETLNLPSDLSFGVEIEYEKVLKFLTNWYVNRNLKNWNSKSDGSLKSGGEVVSPLLYDDAKSWIELKSICEYLKKKRANTFNNAGGHIHVGAHILGKNIDNWMQFLKLYAAYESIIFRFSYGDKNTARHGMLRYAFPIADILKNKINYIDYYKDGNDFISFSEGLPHYLKYQSLNLSNVKFNYIDSRDVFVKNTIEFRCPNATTEEVIWQNNINAFTKMLIAPSKKIIDEDFLDYKLKYEFVSYLNSSYMYNEISLKNALEFVDLIFDNNLDKVYFLRQYLKDYKEDYDTDHAIKTKRFIK